ncbi:MAG: VOC family protein [Chloroflexi bacterium]|nr:VOC family protein [Chloroflexota bacterium]
MLLRSVDHVAFTVSNLERSLEFYRDLLGLDVILKRVWDEDYVRQMVGYPDASLYIALLKLPGEQGALLTADGALIPGQGNFMLELIEYQQPRSDTGVSQINSPGNAHLCFIVDDIQEFYRRLLPTGVTFISAPVTVTAGPNKGRQAVYLRDRDGIVIQLMQP